MSIESNQSHKGLRVADLVQSGKGQTAAIERAPGVYESRGVGNSYLLTTPAGDVLVNAGALRDARRGRELFSKVSKGPIRYIILTQSHANQFGGLEIYKTSENQVIAHRNYPEDRRYSEALSAHYRRITRKMWGQIAGRSEDIVPTKEVAPSSGAPAIVELAGGADRISERARDFVAEGKPLEALHLLDIALAAEPDSAQGRDVKRAALGRLLEQTSGRNFWERRWIAAEIRELGG